MYWKLDDETGEKIWCQPVEIKLVACSFNKDNLKDIEKEILVVLSDKAFEGVCWFEQ